MNPQLTTTHRHDYRLAEHDADTFPGDVSGVYRAQRRHPFVRCAERIARLDVNGKGMVALPNDVVGDCVIINHEARWLDHNNSPRKIERSEIPFDTHEQAALALLWKLEDELALAESRRPRPTFLSRVLNYLRGGK
jgi:hypothetical protein